MDWTAIGIGVSIATIIFWSGSFYGRASKSNGETKERIDKLEKKFDAAFAEIKDEVTQIRIDLARWEGPQRTFRDSDPEFTVRTRGKGASE